MSADESITSLSEAVAVYGALPVPAGPVPQAESLPLKVVVELNDLRVRLAAVANPPREVFLALYEGAEPELFTTVEAARECCDDLAKTDAGEKYWDWTVNEYGIHVQFWTHPDDDRPLSETSGTVTPVVVQGAEPLSELERLTARVAELERTVQQMCDGLNGHDCPPPDETPMGLVTRFAVRLMEAERLVAELESGQAADGSYLPALPWAALLDAEDLAGFLDELAASAIVHATSEVALAEVEKACGTWRLIAEAQHGHNSAPGPDAVTTSYTASPEAHAQMRAALTRHFAGEPEPEFHAYLHHPNQRGHDLPETGGTQ